MKLRPLGDRVIIRRVDAERKTASGIVIPETAQDKPDHGEVLSVGPGATTPQGALIPMQVQVGDLVLFGKYSGQIVTVDREELLVMREADLFAVLSTELTQGD